MAKDPNATPKHRHSIVLVAGIWITVVTASIWAGGYLINKISAYLPYCLGIGILVLSIGLFIEMRKKNTPTEERQQE